MEICQLFLHEIDGDIVLSETGLAGHRKPTLGKVKFDSVLDRLTVKHNSQRPNSLKKGSGSTS